MARLVAGSRHRKAGIGDDLPVHAWIPPFAFHGRHRRATSCRPYTRCGDDATRGSPQAYAYRRNAPTSSEVAAEQGSAPKKLWASDTWLAPIEAQLAGLRVDDRMVAEVIAVLSRADQPAIRIDHARFDRRSRQLALEVADGKIGEREFLAAMTRLKEERAGFDEMLPSGPGISATEAVDYIRKFAATWAKAKPASRAALVQSVYEEIVVRGEEFVKVRLTQDAYAHGFALALPAQVSDLLLPGRGRPRNIFQWRARQESDVGMLTRDSGRFRSRDTKLGRPRRRTARRAVGHAQRGQVSASRPVTGTRSSSPRQFLVVAAESGRVSCPVHIPK